MNNKADSVTSRLLHTLSSTLSESRNDVPNIGLSAESLIQSSLLTSTGSIFNVSLSMALRWKAILSSPVLPSASSVDERLAFRERSMDDLP
jgi:hypothetical protein